jgi:hypothetical protein
MEVKKPQDAMAAYYIPASESIWGKKEFDQSKVRSITTKHLIMIKWQKLCSRPTTS